MKPLQNIVRAERSRSNPESGEATHQRPLSFRLRRAPRAGAARRLRSNALPVATRLTTCRRVMYLRIARRGPVTITKGEST